MSFNVRNNETILSDSRAHWSSFFVASMWALFALVPLIGVIATPESPLGLVLGVAFVAFGPLVFKVLDAKAMRFVVTNQRFYMEKGILAKNSVEVPTSKINDVSFRQTLLQRLLGTGTLVIMTGNSSPTVVGNIDKAREFREHLSSVTSKQSA